MSFSVSGENLILAGTFVYFGIGALIAFGIAYVELGFTGKTSPMVVAVFFFWPAFWLMKIHGGVLFVLAGLLTTSFMTWLAYVA